MVGKFRWVFIAFVLLIFSSTSICSVLYQVTDVGSVNTYAMGLNEKNQVVGYVEPGGPGSKVYAFVWSTESGLISLDGYRAYAINDLGQVAGKLAWIQAGVWENGSWITLEGRQSAVAINNLGQVTGLINAQPSMPGPYAPYRDDDIHTPGFVELERPYTLASHGFDINEKGQVVADCGCPWLLYVGVFYESDGTYKILDNGGNYDTHARSINDFSQIVGNSVVAYGSDHLAVFWDGPDSDMEYMGTLGNGSSVAYAINNSGQAVGFSASRAFVWTKFDGMYDLNNLIDPELGITLTRSTDISNNGSIVAQGVDSLGQKRSYLLTLPRPWTVDIDIKPGSCPNPLNVKSLGVLPVTVLGSEDFDVSSIDIASIRLAGVAPIRSSYEDVATPVSDSNECECSTEGPDGFLDLTLKFETRRIVGVIGEVNDGDELVLELTGVLSDETPIEGSDCVIIRGRHKPINKADFNGDGTVDMADFAAFAENWLQSSIVEY